MAKDNRPQLVTTESIDIAPDVESRAAVAQERAAVAGVSPAQTAVWDDGTYQAGIERQKVLFDKESKVKIRVPKAAGPQVVIVNGHRYDIPANIFVEVPETVAQILLDAERI